MHHCGLPGTCSTSALFCNVLVHAIDTPIDEGNVETNKLGDQADAILDMKADISGTEADILDMITGMVDIKPTSQT